MGYAIDRLFDIGEAFLAAVQAEAISEGITLPDRQGLAAGINPIIDCEQVTVWFERMYAHEGSSPVQVLQPITPHVGFVLRAVAVNVLISRCAAGMTPNGLAAPTPPSAATETDRARDVERDAILVSNAIVVAVKAGDITGCNYVAYDSWQAMVNEGGFVGGVTRFIVGL